MLRCGLRKASWLLAVGLPCLVVLSAAAHDQAAAETGGAIAVAQVDSRLEAWRQAYKRPASVPYPPENPSTPAKQALGEMLFFDPRLSRSGSVSCASCHNPSLGWRDALPTASGFRMQPLPRRTPSVLNSAWLASLMWDGRADTLEAQALMPLTAPTEMNMTMPEAVQRLQAIAGYQPLFEAAFGAGKPIDGAGIQAALATYERSLVSPRSAFDAWVDGDDHALSAAALRGFALFTGKAGCVSCHSSWRFTDDSFHDIGLPGDDPGRGRYAPPQVVPMQHAFKTPSLRDLPPRGHYMHDGSIDSLPAVLAHYAAGGIERPSHSQQLRPLQLSDSEREDLLALLSAISGPPLQVRLPQLPQ